MKNTSIIQQALGNMWHKLPLVIQNHYGLQQGQLIHNVVTGTMYINYPAFIKPMLFITRLLGGLIDVQDANMTTRVEKWVNADQPQTLFWKRTIQAQNGKSTVFTSRMEYQRGNEPLLSHSSIRKSA